MLDFDERVVRSIEGFAERFGLADRVSAELYNVADALPQGGTGSGSNVFTPTRRSVRVITARVMKPPRSKLRGITRKGIVCEAPRFLTLFPLQGNLEASSEESPD